MSNTNCLEGVKCPNPKCTNTHKFGVSVFGSAVLTDDGVEHVANIEYDGDSMMWCNVCGHNGYVRDFEHAD